MEEICPNCGSLDIIQDCKQPWMLICCDCDNRFPSNSKNQKVKEDEETNIYDPTDKDTDGDIEEDGLIEEDLGF